MMPTAEITRTAKDTPRISANTPRKVIAMLSGCVLAGALLSAGPASAASRGFVVHNQCTHALHLQAVKAVVLSDGCGHARCLKLIYRIAFEGRPNVGSVLNPGHAQRFELKWDA